MQRRPVYVNDSFCYVAKVAESEQPVGAQESFVFLILGVGRPREDRFIYLETRENVFFIIWDL